MKRRERHYADVQADRDALSRLADVLRAEPAPKPGTHVTVLLDADQLRALVALLDSEIGR